MDEEELLQPRDDKTVDLNKRVKRKYAERPDWKQERARSRTEMEKTNVCAFCVFTHLISYKVCLCSSVLECVCLYA